MKEAELIDRNLVLELLFKSFKENLSVNYIIRQDNKRLERIRALMGYSIDVCTLFGKVWLSDNKQACALVLYPHVKKTTLRSVWLNLNLIFRSIGIGGISKAIKRESLIKGKQLKENMAYLWFIGVDPEHQHSGVGSKLLEEVIADAENKNLPVFLETSTLQNLPWYDRFAFHIYDELLLTYTLYFLKRDLSK
ncbi:GNAT family N-acetyltransferase [Pedobacter antarcticus]|uniref:GNAT family N-acetyltransferase n=1 Tax=Pedobacter antarcticus TaxID=34086 RepID=UPI002931C608|nr:GNAT family N-acetyltransferase [Pedobacter antarcticus]